MQGVFYPFEGNPRALVLPGSFHHLYKGFCTAAHLGVPGGVLHLQGCGVKVFFFYSPDHFGESEVSAHTDGESACRATVGSQACLFDVIGEGGLSGKFTVNIFPMKRTNKCNCGFRFNRHYFDANSKIPGTNSIVNFFICKFFLNRVYPKYFRLSQPHG